MRSKIMLSFMVLIVVQMFLLQIGQSFLYLNKNSAIVAPLVMYLTYTYITTVFIATTVLVGLEMKGLNDFHLEKWTLWLLVVSSVSRARLFGFQGEGYFLIIIALSGISLAVLLVKNRVNVPKTRTSGGILAVGLGFLIAILAVFIVSPAYQLWLDAPTFSQHSVWMIAVKYIIYQLSTASLIEEIIFRGFIWGYLTKLGWSDKKAFWVQGILFWLLHFSQFFFYPLSFLVVVPLSTLVLSYLTKQYKQVFPSVLYHTIVNVLTPILINIIFL